MRTNKNDDISRYIRQAKRRDRYERDCERRYGSSFCGSDDEYGFAQAAYRQWQRSENEKKSYRLLYTALDDLRLLDPAGYMLISEYYIEGGVTFTEIGKKHGISRQACTKRIRKCLETLKLLVELHKLKD